MASARAADVGVGAAGAGHDGEACLACSRHAGLPLTGDRCGMLDRGRCAAPVACPAMLGVAVQVDAVAGTASGSRAGGTGDAAGATMLPVTEEIGAAAATTVR